MADPRGFLKHDRRVPRILPVVDRVQNHAEHYEVFSDEQVRTQASRCMDCGVPFCMSGCPLGNRIPDFNDEVWRDRWEDALHALHATNNFPEVTGRVCPAPCETSCVLGINAPPVAIKLSELSIVNRGFERGIIQPRPPAVRTSKKVAVIGSGPAGLACAQQLNRAGHNVTVYEKNDRAGGLMMYGIPHYKLDKRTLQRRVDQLEAEGIRLELGVAVGAALPFAELRAKFDAVVLAIGSEHPRDLPIEGRDADGVHFAMEFLPQSNRLNWGDADPAALHPTHQRIDAAGKQVIVIGGGDTGSDCIGTSIRQGATRVVNFELMPNPPENRRPDNPWPQWARVRRVSSSVEEMNETSGPAEFAIATKRFTTEGGRVTGLETVRLDWSEGRPAEVRDSTEHWPADLVLLAMGYLGPVQPGLLTEVGCSLTDRGAIATDGETRMTSIPGVFAAGDARRGQSLVVWAIAEGREVARCVDEFLTGRQSLLPSVRLEPFQY